ncbi:aldo/keto reductase [Oligoflexia bacterium]|nr:aldo/keto reductase [Oligoflexia bacterium]
MRYKLLGNSGLRVSELCLGTMTFGEEWGWGATQAVSQQIFDAFVEAGGNFIDTANYYTAGTSERYLGDFIHAERNHFVLATKYTLNTNPDDPNTGGNHRKNLHQAVEHSLKRLQTDYIDLLWVHAWDPLTPLEETMRALDDLVRAGKVLYVGVSDTPAWVVARANTMAELRSWSPFVALQLEYNLVERTVERELLPMAEALKLGVTAWGPLSSGLLTGKYTVNKDSSASRRITEGNLLKLNERNLGIASTVDALAKEANLEASHIALAWLRHRGVIPILGARTIEQMHCNLACLEIELNAGQLKILEEVSQIEFGFPHEFLRRETIQKIIYGNTLEQIDHQGRYRV